MKTVAHFLILSFLSSSSLHAVSIQCKNLNDTGQRVNVEFDSNKPFFKEAGTALISPQVTCNRPFNFTKGCETHLYENYSERVKAYHFWYEFRCDEVFGKVYFVGGKQAFAHFSCDGEKVPATIHSRSYSNCSLTK